MKNIAIIAEYNPLHNGHLYQMRTLGDNNIIVAMSGNFTERGDIAVASKYNRARLAVEHGASIVVEIPTMGVLSCAEHFARCAIKTLTLLGGVDELCFGSECGDINILKSIASIDINGDQCRRKMSELTKSGMSYPSAWAEIVKGYDCKYGDIIDKPNNILGIEYIKALKDTGIEPTTIRRIGSNYNDNDLSGEYASASSIRANLDTDSVRRYMPSDVLDAVKENSINNDALLYALYQKMILESSDISDIVNISEGIENRISSMLLVATNYHELLEGIKTKRYTMARIKRSLIDILLDIKKADLDTIDSLDYITVLAIKRDKLSLLSNASSNIVTRYNDYAKTEHISSIIDRRANALYNMVSEDKIIAHNMIIVD